MHALIIKLIADGLVVVIAIISTYALIAFVPNKHKFEAYARILMAGLTALLFARLIGSIYQPAVERPFELLGLQPGAAYLNNPGFPSDHALFAMALTLAVWFETKRRRLALALFILTIIMCVGRVLALVHTPLDVIGGVLIACGGALWYDWQPMLRHKRVHTTHSHKVQK